MSVRILVGDVRERLKEIPDKSVHCCVTSPPYYGLRNYGVAGQIGLEPTLAEYLAVMVEVFREVRRVMRDDATLWLNIGDSYNAYNGNRGGSPSLSGAHVNRPILPSGSGLGEKSLKSKDLMMVPARLAIALQDDGWWLRSDIIWHKPNPMPESVRDRPTSAHEHIFLLTKSARYYYDADAVKTEPTSETKKTPDGWNTASGAHGSFHPNGREKGARIDKQRGHERRHAGFSDRWDAMPKEEQQANGANLRNVWRIATKPFKDAHFATFPPEIPRRCIKAGCPVGGTVIDLFSGSGTTGLVADELGRNAILIDVNPEYAEMAAARIKGSCPLFVDLEVMR